MNGLRCRYAKLGLRATPRVQSARQTIMKPLIEEAINELCCITTPPPASMAIADLGSSCGPSALNLVSNVVDAIHHVETYVATLATQVSLINVMYNI